MTSFVWTKQCVHLSHPQGRTEEFDENTTLLLFSTHPLTVNEYGIFLSIETPVRHQGTTRFEKNCSSRKLCGHGTMMLQANDDLLECHT